VLVYVCECVNIMYCMYVLYVCESVCVYVCEDWAFFFDLVVCVRERERRECVCDRERRESIHSSGFQQS